MTRIVWAGAGTGEKDGFGRREIEFLRGIDGSEIDGVSPNARPDMTKMAATRHRHTFEGEAATICDGGQGTGPPMTMP